MTPPDGVLAAPWRVFVALRVPGPVAASIGAAVRAALPPSVTVRLVDPADLHLTVWFVGQLAPAELAAVGRRVAAAAATAGPIECGVAGTGSFGRGRGRATWVGLAEPGAGAVAALAVGLTAGQPHQAHMTVCRGAPAAFAADLAALLAERGTLAWRATSVEILRSHRGRRPAYETVAVFPLGTGAGA